MGKINLFETEDMRREQDHRAMRSYLGQSFRMAVNQYNGDQTKALKELAEAVERDKRFDPYDKQRVVDRFSECYSSGQHMDFDDGLAAGSQRREPYLKSNSMPTDAAPIHSYRVPRR